jgi:D-galactonate transporter
MERSLSASVPETVARQMESIYSKVSLRLIPFLFLCYIFSFLDRVNVGFAKLQMQKDLALSDTVYGLGAGIFFLGYFLFEVPSNLLLEKFGPRKWIGRIMITWGLVCSAAMFSRSSSSFYACRFLLGVMEAGFFPGIILYLTYWYPEERRAHITAMFLTAIPVAGLVGSPISGWIMQTFTGTAGLAGWKWLFLLEGIPSVLLGVATLFYLDDSIESAGWLERDEKKLLANNIAAEKEAKTHHSLRDGLVEWRVWFFGVVYFCFVSGLYGFSFWLPQMIKSSGVGSELRIGLLTAVPNGLAIAGMLWAGRSSDLMLERRWHTLVCGLVAGLGLMLSAGFAANTWIAVFSATLGLAGVMACLSIFWSFPTAILSGTAAAGGIALVNSVGNLGGFASPYMMGYVKDLTGDLSSGLFVLGALVILGAVLVIVFVPGRDH